MGERSEKDIYDRFDEIVEEALLDLPAEFAEKMENVEVIVKDKPDRELLRKLKRPGGMVLGLYHGVPRGKRSVWSTRAAPDTITIFKVPILSICRSEAEVRKKIREVVIHEIGHYFGLSDRDMRKYEK